MVMSVPLDVTRVGDEYRVRTAAVSFRFRSLTPHHDGPTAIVEALDLSIGGRPHVDRLSLLSSRSRQSLARALIGRWPAHDWSSVLDDACHLVDEAMSHGEPPLPLTPLAPAPADTDLVEGLIPVDQITVLYADGGSLKSYFALALAVAARRNEPLVNSARWCVRACQSVLYLDWETDHTTHRRRLWRLLKGIGTDEPDGLHYLNMRGRPLHASLQAVSSTVAGLGSDLLIIDSLGMACGDEPETALANLRTLGALQTLPGTKLVLAHVNAQTAISPNGPGRPYGSVFIRNTARSAIEARSEPEGENGQLVTYYHRKANDGPLVSPAAIRYEFQAGGAMAMYSSQPDLQYASVSARIEQVLASGSKSAATLAEELDLTDGAVRRELGRMEKRGTVVRLEAGGRGRGDISLWGLIDAKRGGL